MLERATRNKRANNIFLRVENELVRRGEREGLKRIELEGGGEKERLDTWPTGVAQLTLRVPIGSTTASRPHLTTSIAISRAKGAVCEPVRPGTSYNRWDMLMIS